MTTRVLASSKWTIRVLSLLIWMACVRCGGDEVQHELSSTRCQVIKGIRVIFVRTILSCPLSYSFVCRTPLHLARLCSITYDGPNPNFGNQASCISIMCPTSAPTTSRSMILGTKCKWYGREVKTVKYDLIWKFKGNWVIVEPPIGG